MSRQIQVTFDAHDPSALSSFWRDALGYVHPGPPGVELPEGADPLAAWDDFLERAGVPKDQRNTEAWLDRNAFFYTAPGTFGNIARNRLIGPSQLAWDFSVLKNFFITETHRLQFRFEAFNFANHPILGNPGASWGSNAANPIPAFGRIRSTVGTMRQIQFGLKYIF